MSTAPHVAIVGGGLAGLSSAVHLARDGYQVTLLEQRPFLGGRTYSFRDKKTGEITDNGQHVFTPGYDDLFEYLRIIGTEQFVHFADSPRMAFKDPEVGTAWLAPPKLPEALAPLGGLLAFLNLKNIGWRDKLGLFAIGARMARDMALDSERLECITADRWFRELGISRRFRRAFWDPFTISTLNEKPERVSAYQLAQLFRWGASQPDPARPRRAPPMIGYPTTDLNALLVDPAVKYLKDRGADVRTGCTLTDIRFDERGDVTALILKDGGELRADAYLLAVHPRALAKLVQHTRLKDDAFFARVCEIEEAPIVGVNVWLDRPLGTESDFDGLLDTSIEWVFDRNKMHEGRQGEGHFYTLIVSASWALMEKSNNQIAELAVEELRGHYPQARGAKVLNAVVVREPWATFSAVPGFQRLRCTQKTPVRNLFLAGDWTDTELPSTMESAVRSGVRAVKEVRRYLPA